MWAFIIYLYIVGMAGVMRSEEPLDLNELFPSFNESDPYEDLPTETYRNISLDIEKLDINKIKHKMLGEMKHKFRDEEDEMRDIIESGRRTALTFHEGRAPLYKQAYRMIIHQLQCDMMLQLIYMAKGQITIIENSEAVNTRDTGYRAGYINHKCARIFKKIGRILSFMQRWQYTVNDSTGHIVLHHRSVRLHIDFLHYYWLFIRLDALYRQHRSQYNFLSAKPKLPRSEWLTGGVSMELNTKPPRYTEAPGSDESETTSEEDQNPNFP